MKSIKAKQLSDQLAGEKKPRIVDIRDGDAYAAGHIPDTQHIPIKRMQTSPGFAPDDRDVVVYGNSDQDEGTLGHEVARILAAQEIDIYVLEGGLAAWVDAGYPVDFD